MNVKNIYNTVFVILSLLQGADIFAQCSNVTSGGTVGSDQTVCGSFNPANIINSAYPTGGTGTLQYQWQNSPNGTTWSDIAGASLESYDPPTISSTTLYHRMARRSGCTPYGASSNTVTKTVNPLPSASISAGGPISFCSPGSVVLTANSVTGTTYQWKKNGASISGATLQTYAASTTGNYTVTKTITATGCTANSNTIVVSAHAPLTTSITTPGTNFCGASTVIMEVSQGSGYAYQWYEETQLLPNTNYYQLSTGHNGNYSCTITNACGSYPSSTYVLNDPQLNQLPYGVIYAGGSTNFCTGQNVYLYEGFQFFSGYQWYKDGVAISGANSFGYTATLAGVYMVRITDYCWWSATYYDFYSNLITVTSSGGSLPGPAITAGGSTSFCSGGSVLLTEATGTGWTYQWRNNNSNISGATQATYNATASGSYTCAVTNTCGMVLSNAIVVTVLPTSVTISLAGNTTICGGSFAALSASNAGTGGTYQWKLNGTAISGATGASYSATSGGTYSCSIVNSCGAYNSNSITITVSGTCNTGLTFDGTNDYVKIPNHTSYAIGTGNFTIESWINLSSTQTATYPVVLSHRISNNGISGFMVFFIAGKLTIQLAGINRPAYGSDLRDNLCHHIAITRTSTSAINFYVDGILKGTSNSANYNITTSDFLLIGNDAADSYADGFKGKIMEARFWNVARTQTELQNSMNTTLSGYETGLVGYWRMNEGSGQAVNDYSPSNNGGQLGSTAGTDVNDPSYQSACSLTPLVNCSVPSGLLTTNITNTTAQLNWSGATADSFLVRYAIHNTTNFIWQKISGQPNVTSTIITGLFPGTSYDWWVRSLCNSIPSSNYQSNPATFNTVSSAVPCATPYGLGASGIGNTSAMISWTNLVTADTFRVRYSVNGTTNYIWKDVNGSGSHSTLLSGLAPNTTYQFQISSKCVGVSSPYSSPYVFTTLNTAVPCITPYNLGANNIANTSATIFWTNLVTADTFRVRYSINGTMNYIWKDVNGSGGSSTSLSNLAPNTAYQFQVSSKCSGVSSPYSTPYIFTTLNTPVPCITPTGLSTTNITGVSAKVNWTNLVSADTFRVRYSINGTMNFMWKDVNGTGGVTNATLTGLNPSSTYQWQVSSICSGQSSPYSASVIFSTPALRDGAMNERNNSFEYVIVYPNPTHSVATIKFYSKVSGGGFIFINDIAGRIVQTKKIELKEGVNAVELEVEELPRGFYLVELSDGGSAIARVKLSLE